jgi:hypothetical protein
MLVHFGWFTHRHCSIGLTLGHRTPWVLIGARNRGIRVTFIGEERAW